jgi:glycosyltransferase involved in cell wall biosynthesis
MRFHVIGLPHTNTTKEYLSCAYTQKVINFCKMMYSLGHEVFLYGGKRNDAPCTEFIPCSKLNVAPEHYLNFPFDVTLPHWKDMNRAVIANLAIRTEEKDFICIIAGHCQKPIADAFPSLQVVEFGVGYSGVFANYRVFESYAWMHMLYGQLYGTHTADGKFYDVVIPNYFDVEDFQLQTDKEDYFLYLGRLIDRKGYKVAMDLCRYLGKRLIIAGNAPAGFQPSHGEYIGSVGLEKRKELLSKARAVLTPSLYVEPFCGVHVEAMLSGTPVITTDFGAFTETFEHGRQGFRCRTFKEFVHAATHLEWLNSPKAIRSYAISRYSLPMVAVQYEKYFTRLLDLHGAGWYAVEDTTKPFIHA